MTYHNNFWWAVLYGIVAGFFTHFVLLGFNHDPQAWPLAVAIVVFFATFRRKGL